MPRSLFVFTRAALAALFLASCSGGSSPPPEPAVVLKGFVIADDPIVGATVTLTDKDGAPAATGLTATSNQHGAFLIAGDRLPETFTVTAKGGTFNGKAFSGTMRHAVGAGFNPRTRVVYLTPVTTLAAAYGSAYPGETDKEVEAKVRRFLSLPSYVKIAKLKRHDPDQFSAREFMAQAAEFKGSEGSGFDAYVRTLSGEMASGGARTYVALKTRAGGAEAEEASLAVQLLTWTVKNLASGAVGAGGAKLFSTILSAVGAGGPDLTEVQTQLDGISSQISALSDQVSDLKSTLGCDITNYGYNDLVGGDVQSKLDAVESVQAMMDHLSKMSSSDAGYKKEKDDIRASIQSNLAIHTDIYHFIAGNASLDTAGAVKGLGGKLTSCGYFFNAAKSSAVAKQYLYFANLLAGACQMVVNYHNDRSETADAAGVSDACNNTYTPAVLALVTPNSIPAGSNIVIDTRYNLMWQYFGIVQGTYDYPIYTGNFDSALRSAQAATGKVWSVPAEGDVGSFITPCYGSDATAVRNCLSEKGWGTYDDTANTYSSFYGGGDIYFWFNPDGRRRGDDPSYQGGYSPGEKAMGYNGKSSYVSCNCSAGMMIVRELDTSEIYWRK